MVPTLVKCDFWGNLLWAYSLWVEELEAQISSSFDFVYFSFRVSPKVSLEISAILSFHLSGTKICCCSFESRWYWVSISVVPGFTVVALSLCGTKFLSRWYRDFLVWLWIWVYRDLLLWLWISVVPRFSSLALNLCGTEFSSWWYRVCSDFLFPLCFWINCFCGKV